MGIFGFFSSRPKYEEVQPSNFLDNKTGIKRLIDANGHCEIPEGTKEIGAAAVVGTHNQWSGPRGLDLVSIKDYGASSDSFCDCKTLVSVTIPSSVTKIGEAAFYGCTELKTIKLLSSETKIEKSALSRCKSLEAIIVPKGCTDKYRKMLDKAGNSTAAKKIVEE